MLVPVALREEVERGRDEQRGADRLDAAGADEDVEGRREAAGERRSAEHEDAGGVGLARTSARDVCGRNGDHGEHEIERREHPRDRRDRHIELPEDLGERERDDRRVRERESDTDCEQPAAHCASLGTWLPSHAMRSHARRSIVTAGVVLAVAGT